ncbi:MAG: GNAT family N-acetyltransferase [Gammaproteobacteria bacterium]
MTTTVSVGEQTATMAIDLVPVHPGLTEGIRALYGEAPCLSTRCTPEGVQGWVRESIRRRESDEEYSYAILRDRGLVGLCSLRGITSEPRTARLAYLIGRRHRHCGYATEATGMLIAFGFRCLTLDRVYSSCLPDNAGARRVLEKLRFRHTRDGPMPDPAPGPSERLLHFEFSRRRWEARTTR